MWQLGRIVEMALNLFEQTLERAMQSQKDNSCEKALNVDSANGKPQKRESGLKSVKGKGVSDPADIGRTSYKW